MASDPVCGMRVDEHSAAVMLEYEGETFYFCSTHCYSVFEHTPDAYLPAKRRAREQQHPYVVVASKSST